ncbi:MAG: cyclic nucleotide-binding domain-containing protein [Treponema sp.]|jgi:CRP-like cAMP-binding protein|nr:cyclic nucleotide-binding domain-containing protein [Treponema sp.]
MTEQLQLDRIKFKKGTYLIVDAQEAERFFIITSGNVHVSKESMTVVKERDVLGPGDFFGVISAMSSHGHIESVMAMTDVSVLAVQKKQYGDVIRNNSSLAMKIITQFSKQMRYLDEALAIRTLKQKTNEDVSHLIDVAEYYSYRHQYNQAYFVYQQYLKHAPEGDKVNFVKDKLMEIGFQVDSAKLAYRTEGTNRIYPQNTMFFCETEPGDELFIIKKGSVKITKIINQNEVLLAILKDDDIFGEMALLENKPRTASAVAYDDCEVTAVNLENFKRLVVDSPDIVARITTILADRIWLIYKQLISTLLTDPVARMYDMLSIQLQKNRINPENSGSYTFDFGPKELSNMVGLTPADGSEAINKMLAEKTILIIDEKIICEKITDIFKLSSFHWNAYRRQVKINKQRDKKD